MSLSQSKFFEVKDPSNANVFVKHVFIMIIFLSMNMFLQDGLMPLEISTLQFHVELLLSVSENLQQNVFQQKVSTCFV